ncbi:hypothetical protein E2P81_ATG07778 [Venturia nashicola]|nr:hypothetical protein E2P81_ATG07778 [Venturia nashicola]
MFPIKTLMLAALGLSTLNFAAPINTATNSTTDVTDGCDGAYRGEHRACEDGRDQKHAGQREEHRGEREIQNGDLGKGIADIINGLGNQAAGQGRECRTGGHC